VVKLSRHGVNGGKWWYDQVFMLLSSNWRRYRCNSMDPTPSYHFTTLLAVASYTVPVGLPQLSTLLQVAAVRIRLWYTGPYQSYHIIETI